MVDEFPETHHRADERARQAQKLIKKHYMTSTDFVENGGHPSAPAVRSREKALAAFVATL